MGNTLNSKEESNDDGVKPKPVVKPVVARVVPLDPQFKKNLIEYLGGKKFKNPSDKKVFLKHLFDQKPWLEINTPYDEFGNTALMVAIDKSNSDVIGYILHDKMYVGDFAIDKSPVDVTIKNKNNQTALMFALIKNDKVLAKKILKLIPADKLKENLDVQDVDGNTALMMLIQHCDEFTPRGLENMFLNINDFVNAGADMNLKNKKEQTALDIAIQNNKPKFQEFLRAVSAPPQADGGRWSSKSYKSKRKVKKMNSNKKRSGKKRSDNKKRK